MLGGIGLLCHGCDFVPFYGAEQVEINGELTKENVTDYFNKKGTVIKFQEVDVDIKSYPNVNILSFLLYKIIKRRIEDKIFEGSLKDLSNGSMYIKGFSDDIIELIEDDLGKTKVWHVTLENGYEHDAEGLLIEGNVNCLIYFGFSD